MTNDIIPIIAFLFIVSIYCIALFYKINDRVLFYEALDQGDVYNVYIEDSDAVFPLVIENIYNYDLTSYVDITFDYVKYYKVPTSLIYKIIKNSFEYQTIIKMLEKYKYTE